MMSQLAIIPRFSTTGDNKHIEELISFRLAKFSRKSQKRRKNSLKRKPEREKIQKKNEFFPFRLSCLVLSVKSNKDANESSNRNGKVCIIHNDLC